MEIRSFKSLWVRYEENKLAYANYLGELEARDFQPSNQERARLKQLYKAAKSLRIQLEKFGEGSVIRVEGKQLEVDTINNITVEKPFTTYFTGTTVDDIKEYFNTLVKLKIIKVNPDTISYYIIKTGINLLHKNKS